MGRVSINLTDTTETKLREYSRQTGFPMSLIVELALQIDDLVRQKRNEGCRLFLLHRDDNVEELMTVADSMVREMMVKDEVNHG